MRKYCFLIFFALLFSLTLMAQKDSIPALSGLLNLSLEQLMDIKVVTASGYMQTTAEAPSTIKVITAKEIEDRGYEQLEDALRDVPGIDMIHINGYAPTLIYFRGMYGAENLRALLMIDGIAENNILGSNDMAGPTYSLHNVERIEIIWGPMSALYGANAFGGVINIISKKGKDMEGLHVEQGFGSFNTRFEKFSTGMQKDNIEFGISGTLYSSDGPRFTNRDPNYDASFVDKAYSFNGQLSYHAKKTSTTIGFRTFKTPMGWGTYSNSPTIYLGLPGQGYDNKGIIGVLQSPINGEMSGLDVSYLRTWFVEERFIPNSKINLTGHIIYRETGIGDNSYIYVTADGKNLIRLPIATYSNRVSGDITGSLELGRHQKIAAGIQCNQDNVEAGARRSTLDLSTIYLWNGKDTLRNLRSTFLPRVFDIRTNLGGYMQYVVDLKFWGKTNITAGGRYDHNSYFGDAFSPRIAVVNQPNDRFTFKLQFGNAFRSPTNLEIHQTPVDSNFQLKKEKIFTYEINAVYTSKSKNLRMQLNAFRNDLSDVIILGNISSPLTPDKNPGIFSINGFEAAVDADLEKNISAFFNFTYQHTWGKNLITNNSGKLPGVAGVKGNAGFTFHFSNNILLTLTGNWVGERRVPRTDPYGPVKGYFLTNCFLSARNLMGRKITLSLNIHNIFDTKWLDPGFRTADGLLYSTVLEQPGVNGLFKIGIGF